MKKLIIVLFTWLTFTALSQPTNLVPFFNNPAYARNEPINPPWFVSNNNQPSMLYYNGTYQSQETGTNDLNMVSAWAIQTNGVPVGIITLSSDMPRMIGCVSTISPNSTIYQINTTRWGVDEFSAGISNMVNSHCQIIVFNNGWSISDNSLSNACLYANVSNVIIIVSAPNVDESLELVSEYPYNYYFPNVLYVSSTDRNGLHYSPSATGQYVIAAPGRNIVAAGTYSSGTSWAAPLVAGGCALLMQQFPGQTPTTYINLLLSTASSPAQEINIVSALMKAISLMPPKLSLHITNGQLNVSWSGNGTLQYADTVVGPWSDVDNATNPYMAFINGPRGFYRLRKN